MKYKFLIQMLAGLVAVSGVDAMAQGDSRLVIHHHYDALGFAEPVPVNISGFTSEVAGILRQDLLFMGMTNAPADQAKYLIDGGNSGRVEARVTDRITKNPVLAKAYTGGSTRSQVHALADDIAKAITGVPGIAQTKIAFKAESGPAKSEIYISDYDGFNPLQVTRDNTIVSAPDWAGKSTLFYASYKLGNPRIFSHNLPTGARQMITPYGGANISPAVSSDGTRVAMILSKNGSPNLYVSDLGGKNLKQLTFSREGESSPCWSPDNKTICFVSRESGVPGLYAISANGSGKRRISTVGSSNPTEPDWSPDGKYIVFTSQMRHFEIFIVPAEGGSTYDIAEGEDAVWAPNSRAVVFSKGPDHAKSLYLLDVPTKQVKTIARILGSNSQPSWAK
ncbi:MAG: Translocation protein TolB [Verrucomicrobiales bacterium]|nr:Translocation protein TolB [Verrucomicrobiales bacterium]